MSSGKRLVKHYVGDGPDDYTYVKRFGIEPCRFTATLQRVFPNANIRDPHLKDPTGRRNPIYIAAGAAGTARVYIRHADGSLHQPVRLAGDTGADVRTWYKCMREVYNDLGLPLPFEELEHHVHCLEAAGKLGGKAGNAVRILRNIYRAGGNL